MKTDKFTGWKSTDPCPIKGPGHPIAWGNYTPEGHADGKTSAITRAVLKQAYQLQNPKEVEASLHLPTKRKAFDRSIQMHVLKKRGEPIPPEWLQEEHPTEQVHAEEFATTFDEFPMDVWPGHKCLCCSNSLRSIASI